MKKIILPFLLLCSILLTFSCNRKDKQTVAETPAVERTAEAPREARQKLSIVDRIMMRLEGIDLTDDQNAQIGSMAAKANLDGLGREEMQAGFKTLMQDIIQNVLTSEQQQQLRALRTAQRQEREKSEGGGK